MINVPQGFSVTANEAIDNRIVMTKKQMKNVKDAWMPQVYFAICSEIDSESGQHALYIYRKNRPVSEISPVTGKFMRYSGNYADLVGLPTINDVPVIGDKESSEYGLQGILQASEGIII